jgi:hypothetical protein
VCIQVARGCVSVIVEERTRDGEVGRRDSDLP